MWFVCGLYVCLSEKKKERRRHSIASAPQKTRTSYPEENWSRSLGGPREGKGVSSVAVSTWVLWSFTHSPMRTHVSFTPTPFQFIQWPVLFLLAEAKQVVSKSVPRAAALIVAPEEWLIRESRQQTSKGVDVDTGGLAGIVLLLLIVQYWMEGRGWCGLACLTLPGRLGPSPRH